MAEVSFVIKTFIATLILLFVLQFRVGSITLEQRSVELYEKTAASGWVQSVASGGALAFKNGKEKAEIFLEKIFSKDGHKSERPIERSQFE